MGNKAVIIPAAGIGTRFGSEVPKPFIKLAGIPILQHSILPFLKVDGMSQIIIPTSAELVEQCENIVDSIVHSEVEFSVIKGGKERQDSIRNAIDELNADVKFVAVHDAVRPFVTTDQINKCFAGAQEFDGAVLGVPAKDTIKKVDGNSVINETPDRDFLWQAQTPQVFKKDILMKAYESAKSENFLGTDDASLVERVGGKVKMIEGDRKNLKITFPIDYKVAELIMGDMNE